MKQHPLFPLVDLNDIRIDPTLPGDERVRLFTEQISDPHYFRVAETPVEIVYADGAPSLQRLLTDLCGRAQ